MLGVARKRRLNINGRFFAPMKRTHALNEINIEFGGVGGGGGYDVLAWAFFSHTPVVQNNRGLIYSKRSGGIS